MTASAVIAVGAAECVTGGLQEYQLRFNAQNNHRPPQRFRGGASQLAAGVPCQGQRAAGEMRAEKSGESDQ